MNLPSRRQVLHLLGLLVLIAVVVPFVIHAVPGIVGADGSYVVLSGSMEPSISPGDVVIVGETDPATIEAGDVITYTRDDAETPTTHRVVEVLEQDGTFAFRTQGDANDEPDASLVSVDQMHGEVILTIPYIGHVISFVNTPFGFATLVVAPFALLLLSELYELLRSGRDSSTGDGEAAPDDDTNETTPPADVDSSNTQADASPGEPVDAQLPSTEATETSDGSSPVNQTDRNGATANSSDESTAERPDEATITITREDLRLSLALLAGFAVYAGWVVMHVREPWAFAAAFAAGIGLVLVAGMYYLAGSPAPTEAQPTHDEPDVRAGDGGTVPQSDPVTVVERPPAVEHHGESNERDVAPESVEPSQTTNETGCPADRTEPADDERNR